MAGEISNEELKEILRSLCITLKCVVCLGPLQRDTLTCVNGHCICLECQGIQELCPTCREGFSNIKQNSLVRQILDITPHICLYDKCGHLVRSRDDHESYCRFRPTPCKFCEDEVLVAELADHVTEKHLDKKIFLEKDAKLGNSGVTFEESWKVASLHRSFGHFLWQVQYFEPSTRVLTVIYTPVFCGKPTHDIYVNISLESEEEYEARKKIKMNINVNPLEENCLLIPISVAQQCILKDKLLFKVNITKKGLTKMQSFF